MVELRKRPAPAEPAAPAPKRGKSVDSTKSKSKPSTTKAKTKSTTKSKASPKEQSPDSDPAPAKADPDPDTDTKAETKGGEIAKPTKSQPLSSSSINSKFSSSTPISTHESTKTTISELLAKSDSGIVIFTYPKASTPGCTTQACSFRDNYGDIKAKGYEVYGLSKDSVKANANFATKKEFGYLLLCDEEGVVKELGMGKGDKVARGVVVLKKDGTVKVWMQGGPAATVDAVKAETGL